MWYCVSFFGSGGKWFLVLRTYLMYNTVVRLCQLFCCGGKVNFVRILYIQSRSLLRPEKKSSSLLSGGCAIIITTGKKSSSRDFYAKLNASNLNVMNLY